MEEGYTVKLAFVDVACRLPPILPHGFEGTGLPNSKLEVLSPWLKPKPTEPIGTALTKLQNMKC